MTDNDNDDPFNENEIQFSPSDVNTEAYDYGLPVPSGTHKAKVFKAESKLSLPREGRAQRPQLEVTFAIPVAPQQNALVKYWGTLGDESFTAILRAFCPDAIKTGGSLNAGDLKNQECQVTVSQSKARPIPGKPGEFYKSRPEIRKITPLAAADTKTA